MNMGKIIAALLVVVAFAAGMQFGKKTGGAPVVTSAGEGATYGGSAQGDGATEG